MSKSTLMKNKKGLVMGVANERSIGWAIAKKLKEAGAEIALTYQGEALKKRIYPLAKEINSKIVLECDVENEKEIAEIKGIKHRLVTFPLKYLRYLMIFVRQKKKFDSISGNLIVSNSKYKKDFNWEPPFIGDLGFKKSI